MTQPNRTSIPRSLPRWLRRYPVTLAAAIAALNGLHRAVAPGRPRLLGAVALVLGASSVWALITHSGTVLVIAQALGHAAIVVAVAALYAASLISRRRRAVETALAQSWLVATPLARTTSGRAIVAPVIASLLARLLAAAALTLLASLNADVTLEQSLELIVLLTGGVAAGAPLGWWLARRTTAQRHESSRYTRRPKPGAAPQPSAAALSSWPVAQALAWARPENARLLLATAILTVPGGTGLRAGVAILVSWIVASYLGALLLAVPHVARGASDWLRSTPITFWAFAWPLARRVLVHQLCGTLVGIAVMVLLGSAPIAALYAGAVWLTLVVLVAALSVADCYRARSPGAKITLSILAALVTEQRAHGWGVSLALLLAALHLYGGARHARA